jgi:hypothetical protein
VGLKVIKNNKGNQAYNLLMNLKDKKFDSIRETPEFKEICENLKKYAKEDE